MVGVSIRFYPRLLADKNLKTLKTLEAYWVFERISDKIKGARAI